MPAVCRGSLTCPGQALRCIEYQLRSREVSGSGWFRYVRGHGVPGSRSFQKFPESVVKTRCFGVVAKLETKAGKGIREKMRMTKTTNDETFPTNGVT
jgi:hypothetical protein